jgi:hypothetical protein
MPLNDDANDACLDARVRARATSARSTSFSLQARWRRDDGREKRARLLRLTL